MGTDWFWVVFDTSQYAKYYGDVHDLLALPAGTTLKYDYAETEFSSSALHRVPDPGAPVLFVYTQYEVAYSRERGESKPSAKVEGVAYVGTRLGRIQAVTKNGKRYNLDFTVEGYPNQGEHLESILKQLAGHGETPLAKNAEGVEFRKYVCVSTNTAALKQLEAPDEQLAWAAIVTALSTPPMQFSSDTFWRLVGPFTKRKGKVLRPELDKHMTDGKVTAVESVYNVSHGTTLRFDFVSKLGAGGGQPQNAQVDVQSTENDIARVVGASQIQLRRYTARHFEVRGYSASAFDQSKADIRLNTSPQQSDGWPSGPSIHMAVRVSGNKWRTCFGIAFGIAGVVAYGIGDSKAADTWGGWATTLKIVGILLVVLSGQLISGDLSFSVDN